MLDPLIVNKSVIAALKQSKLKLTNDEIVVNELGWPFYIEIIKNSKLDYIASTFDQEGNRIDINKLVDSIISIK